MEFQTLHVYSLSVKVMGNQSLQLKILWRNWLKREKEDHWFKCSELERHSKINMNSNPMQRLMSSRILILLQDTDKTLIWISTLDKISVKKREIKSCYNRETKQS